MLSGPRRKYTSVSIPASLFQKIRKRIQGTGFKSVSDYVTYVLRELLAEEKKKPREPFSEEDERRIKARLRALGYLE